MGTDAVVGLSFFIFGMAWILPVTAITFYRWHFRHREDAIQTKAYVIENIYRPSTSVSYPVIEFTSEDGERHRYTSRMGTSPPRVQAGTYTTVFYLRDKPSKYIINGGYIIYLFGIAFSLVGFIASLLGLLIFIGKGDLVDKVLSGIFG